METPKPRQRVTLATTHYRLRLLDTLKQTEAFHCFASMGQQATWLRAQTLASSVEARLSLVEGADCFYCRQQKEA